MKIRSSSLVGRLGLFAVGKLKIAATLIPIKNVISATLERMMGPRMPPSSTFPEYKKEKRQERGTPTPQYCGGNRQRANDVPTRALSLELLWRSIRWVAAYSRLKGWMPHN